MSALTAIDQGLWVVARPQRFLGLHVGTRMTVVRLRDGSLWIHSPVALDDELRGALDELGPVRHVIAPNRFHHLYAGDYAAAYPEAKLYGAPGLGAKRQDLEFAAELGPGFEGEWSAEIPSTPIEGTMLQETVFMHAASRSLISADLLENFTGSDHWPTRLYLKVSGIDGHAGVSRLLRPAFRDRPAARRSVDRVLTWDFERLLVCHGELVERDGRALLREVYTWLKG